MLIARDVCFCGAVLMARIEVLLDEGPVVGFEAVVMLTVLRSLTLDKGRAAASDVDDRCLAFSAAAPSLM